MARKPDTGKTVSGGTTRRGMRVLDEVRGRDFGVHFSLYILRASRQMADIKKKSHVTSLNRTAEIEVIKIHLIKLL